jgi:hypothetical protein
VALVWLYVGALAILFGAVVALYVAGEPPPDQVLAAPLD